MGKGKIIQQKAATGVTILRVKGAFTKDTLPELQKICYEVGNDPSTRGVLLDMKEVTEIDTSAFACVINFIKDHHAPHGVNIGIINIGEREKMLAEILKINSAIRIFGDEKEAVSEFSR